uniref:Serpentine receptor class gamma n=1 Tax=Panagrellus redivivus TaxID=6233 RepID=A0A7E4V2Z8_PANRE
MKVFTFTFEGSCSVCMYTLSYLVKRVVKNCNNTNCLVDTKQFLISFVTFLIESSTMIITVWLFTVSDKALDLACSPALYFLIDACQCLPAWLMVFMNTGIRQTLKEHCSNAVDNLRGDRPHRMKIRISKTHSLSIQTNKF